MTVIRRNYLLRDVDSQALFSYLMDYSDNFEEENILSIEGQSLGKRTKYHGHSSCNVSLEYNHAGGLVVEVSNESQFVAKRVLGKLEKILHRD